MDELTIAVEGEANVVVVRVGGEIDLDTAPALDRSLRNLIADGEQRIVLDFAEVSFIDSSGFKVLVATHKRLGGGLAIARPQLPVARTLVTAGLVHLIEVHDTVELAAYMITGLGDPRA